MTYTDDERIDNKITIGFFSRTVKQIFKHVYSPTVFIQQYVTIRTHTHRKLQLRVYINRHGGQGLIGILREPHHVAVCKNWYIV